MEHLARTKLLLGDGVDKLRQKTVAVFGLGGVGGHVVGPWPAAAWAT